MKLIFVLCVFFIRSVTAGDYFEIGDLSTLSNTPLYKHVAAVYHASFDMVTHYEDSYSDIPDLVTEIDQQIIPLEEELRRLTYEIKIQEKNLDSIDQKNIATSPATIFYSSHIDRYNAINSGDLMARSYDPKYEEGITKMFTILGKNKMEALSSTKKIHQEDEQSLTILMRRKEALTKAMTEPQHIRITRDGDISVDGTGYLLNDIKKIHPLYQACLDTNDQTAFDKCYQRIGAIMADLDGQTIHWINSLKSTI